MGRLLLDLTPENARFLLEAKIGWGACPKEMYDALYVNVDGQDFKSIGRKVKVPWNSDQMMDSVQEIGHLLLEGREGRVKIAAQFLANEDEVVKSSFLSILGRKFLMRCCAEYGKDNAIDGTILKQFREVQMPFYSALKDSKRQVQEDLVESLLTFSSRPAHEIKAVYEGKNKVEKDGTIQVKSYMVRLEADEGESLEEQAIREKETLVDETCLEPPLKKSKMESSQLSPPAQSSSSSTKQTTPTPKQWLLNPRVFAATNLLSWGMTTVMRDLMYKAWIQFSEMMGPEMKTIQQQTLFNVVRESVEESLESKGLRRTLTTQQNLFLLWIVCYEMQQHWSRAKILGMVQELNMSLARVRQKYVRLMNLMHSLLLSILKCTLGLKSETLILHLSCVVIFLGLILPCLTGGRLNIYGIVIFHLPALSVLATQDKRKPFWNLSLMSIADYYTLAKEIMDLSDLSMLIKLQEGETDYHKFQNALPTRPLKPMQPKLIRPKYDVTCSTLMNQFVVTPFGKMEIDQTYRIKYLSAKGQVKVTRSEYQRGHNFVFKISQLADHFGECYWCSLERSPTEQTNQLCGDGLLILLDIVCDLFAGYENIDVSVFAKVVREKVDEIDICQVDLKALLLNVIHCFSNNEDALLQAAYCLMDEEYTEELLTADLCELPLGLILAIDLVTLQTIHWIKGLIQAQYHPLVPHYIAKYALDNLVANPGNKTLRPSICDEYRQAIGSQFGRCHSMVNAVVTAQNDTEFLKGMLKQVPLVIVVRDESRENLGFFRVKPAYRELFEACLNDKNVVIDPKKMRTLIIETESKGKRVEPGWLSKTFPMDCIAPYDTDILLRDICNGATMKRDDYAAVALALERDMDMIHQNHELPFYAYVHKKAQSLRIASTGGNMSSYAGILDMDFIVTSLYHLFLFKPSIKPSSIDKWQGLKLKSAKAAIMEQVRLTDSADYHIYISNQHLIDFASGFIQEDRMMDPETQKYVHPRIPKPFHEMHESLATTQGNENAWKDFCDPLGLPSLEPLATLERKYEPQFLHGDMMVTVFTERGGLLGVGQGWWNSKKNRFMYRAQYLVEAYVGDFSPLCPIHLKSGVYCYPYFAFHTAVVYLEDVLLDREMLGIGKTILSNSNVMNSDVMKLIVHFEVDRIQKLDLAVKRLKDWYVPLANAMYEMFGSIWITKEYFNDHLETMFLLFAFWFLHLAIIEHREHSVPKELLESNYNKIVKQLPSLFPIEVYVGPKKKATYIGRTGWSFAIDCVFRDYTHKPHYCYPRFNLPFPELNESRSKLEVMRNIHPERLKGIFRKSCAIKLMWNHKKGKPVTGWKDIVYTKWQEPLGFCFGCKRECDKWVRRSPVELCNR